MISKTLQGDIVESSSRGFTGWELLGDWSVMEALYLRDATCAPSKCGEHPDETSRPYHPVDQPVEFGF